MKGRESMSNHRLTFLIALVLLVIGSFGVLIIHEDGVEAVGEPAITVTIAQPKATAHVAPGQDGIVTYTGDVEAEIPWSPSIQYLTVYLQPDAGGWSVSTPAPLVFSRQTKTLGFSLTVQVPPETSHYVQGTLTIGGTWEYDPGVMSGSLEETTAIIYIDQYYICALDTSTTTRQAEKGGYAEFIVEVVNNGNGNDEMMVEVLNLEDLSDDDLLIQMADNEVRVLEKQSVELSISAKVLNTASTDRYEIKLHVKSTMAESLGQPYQSDDMNLYLEVVREIKEPEETPAEDKENPPEEDQEDNEVIPEDPVGDDVDEALEENPEYNPGDRKLPAPGIFGVIFSILVVIFFVRRSRYR